MNSSHPLPLNQVPLRDMGCKVLAFEQCPTALAGGVSAAGSQGGGSQGGSVSRGGPRGPVIAVSLEDGRIVVLEMDPSGFAFR
jgi:hypothetical protein